MNSYAKAETLVGAVAAPLDWARSVALVVAFSLFVALAAQVVVPLPWTPVPLTMQTFAVLLTGALLGSRMGALAMIAYLVEGASGLPFFAGGTGGLAHLVGPAAGYLVAFPAAAYVTGAFAEHDWDRQFFTAVLAMLIGSLVIIFCGWSWFALSTRTNAVTALSVTVVPFIPGDIIKILLAAAVLPSAWKLLKKSQ